MERQRDLDGREVRAIVRRPSGDYLLVRSRAGEGEVWGFPRCLLGPCERAEEALRRLCLTALGLAIDVAVPQQPLVLHVGGRRITCECFLCQVTGDDAVPLGFAAVCWVTPVRLKEYGLDAASQHIAARLQAAHRLL